MSNASAGQNISFRGRTADEIPPDPAPPYQVEAVDFLFGEANFDPAAARSALPPELEPTDDCAGVVALYSVPHGWGLAPFSAFFVGLFVKGHDSPDGSKGIFMAAGYYSGRAGTVFPRDYNSRLAQGQSRQWAEGDRFVGEAGPTGQTAVRFTLQVPTPPGPPLPRSGIHHYLGLRTAGGLNIYSVAFTGPFLPATVVAFDMLPDAPPVIRSLVPLRWEWASLLPRVSLSFSPARPLNGSQAIVAADAAQVSLMDILSRIGHAVALVALDGTVLFINTLAREMLAGALNGGRLTAWRRQDQTHLGAALSTLRPGRLSPPVALRRPGGALPILARALPTSAALTGERAALLLFNDPIAPAPSAELNLNLLGLTPAEARIAAQVGRGLTFREAAQVVGVAESTARSTMKAVYGKLGIGKQSELAVIVARLEGFG